MRRIVPGIAVVCVLGLVSACSSSGGGAASTAPPASTAGSGGATPAGSVGPLTYTPETSQTASAVVTPYKGAVIKATASDGTTYTLTVVAHQVSKPVTISLVPLGNVGGIPSDHPISAVKMQPTGLKFNGPASLTIVPAQPLPAATQTMFLTDDAGKSLGMAVVDVRSKSLTMQVPHFTIAAAASLDPASAGAIAVTNYQNIADQVTAELGAALGAARQQALLGVAEGELPPSMEAKFAQVEAALKTALAANLDNCDVASQLISAQLGLERQRQLLGLTSTTGLVTVNAEIASIFKACEKKAIKQCQAADDPAVLFSFWLGVIRQQQLLGVESNTLPDGSEASTDRATRLCVSFDMTGEVGPVTLKGHVEDIRKPWVVTVTAPDSTGTATVTPTSARGGKIQGTSQGQGLAIVTSGSYTLTKTDTGYTGKGTARSCIVSVNQCSPVGIVRLTFTRPSE